jgi:uncharacterized protein YndB with AHSA1/START domain
MADSGLTLTFDKTIQAIPSQVYNAFTNASVLRQWMCNVATVKPKPGGHFFVAWDEGFYASGEYCELKPLERVVFTWRGKSEPGDTLVTVKLAEQNGGTKVTLEHSGIGSGDQWAQSIENIRAGWKSGLENLASVLETGQDLRFTLRPMLGIGINDFDGEIARRLGVPVSKGIRIDNLIDGMGAKTSGLQSDDVIVGLSGKAVSDYADIPTALHSHRAGDEVEVTFYRGSEKKTLLMKLSQRPLPEIPPTPQTLAEIVHKRNEQILNELMSFIAGITESEADYKPGIADWNVKEILAHLIHGERGFQNYIPEILGGQEPQYDDYAGNLQARVEATVAAFPTLPEIVEEFKRSLYESEALLARLPLEVIKEKGSYWRLCYNSLENPYHFESHLDQMRAAAKAAIA